MKEDIKILKDMVDNLKHRYLPTDVYILQEDLRAIENILNRLEQDEKVIQEMAKELRQRQYNCYGKRIEEIINSFRKKCEKC